MWILFAVLSAFFAGVTSVLAKCGIKQTNSTVATALRTVVVLICAWGMVFIVGSQSSVCSISARTWTFLILSGIATGASWLCYFKALQLGDINKVVPIDKSSTILTVLLSFIFLQETLTWGKGVGVVLMGIGTFLMITKKQTDISGEGEKRKSWIVFALLSALFASLTAIFGKIGIDGVESNLGTALRTSVVLVMAWLTVLVTPARKEVRNIPKKELLFIFLSGIATGASWLCYFRALQDGDVSVVISIDKLSILVTILFSFIVFREKLSVKSTIGLVLVVGGTFAMLL